MRKRNLAILGIATLLIMIMSAVAWGGTVQIAAGGSHAAIKKADGTLWAWGYNGSGQLGDGTWENKASPVQIGTDTDWSAIAVGGWHTMAIKTDGTLWAWGYNGDGELGDGTTDDKDSPTQIGSDTNWAAISAGESHTVALKADGTLWAWGYNEYGQIGDATKDNKVAPVQIGSDTNWAAISAGESHTVALKTDGTLWAWGYNGDGELGDGTWEDKLSPVQIGSDTNWASIATGFWHAIAIKIDGTLWAWGYNREGQLGDDTWEDKASPVQIGVDTNWMSIAAGRLHTVALRTDGTLWAWGDNEYGQLGDNTTNGQGLPIQIGSDTNWASVAAGRNYTTTLKSDGTLWTWGDNEFGQLGDGTWCVKTVPTQTGNGTDWSTVSAGAYYTVAIKTGGTLWAWGHNRNGELGDGTFENKASPVQIGSNTDWSTIAAGMSHTVALKNNGTLWAWGDNHPSPEQIGDDTNWAVITAGTMHSVALKSDGTLWAWGYNSYGQLGDGTTTNKTSPVQIGSDTNWAAISAGAAHTVALKSDGTLWAWGLINSGQGDGTSPVQIGSDTNWAAIAAGNGYSIALKNNGTLWSFNGGGQTTQIGNVTTWALMVTDMHTIAIRTDGTLWAWGNNYYGQLGDGTTEYKALPVQLGSNTNWAEMSAGGAHSAAIRTDGTLWAWGSNYYGQLGDGTAGYKPSPVSTVVAGMESVNNLATGKSGNGKVTGGGTYTNGSTATVAAVPDAGYALTGWSGDCSGSNGTTTVVMNSNKKCIATFAQISNGTCGTASGQALTTAPSTSLCSAGTASAVSGSGPWTWSCIGLNSGTNAACSAKLLTNGSCGTPNGQALVAAPSENLCGAGTASSVSGSGPWIWSCSGANGGTTASCSATLKVNGSCGSSNAKTLTAAPTADLCGAGTASAVSGNGPWTWSCAGVNGGTTASCSASKQADVAPPVNGACGASNGKTLIAAPTADLCSAGTASSVSGSGPWTWSCTGANGGTIASCSATLQTYTITASAGTGGSISPSGSTSINSGGEQQFTVTPDDGYHIADVKVDGKSAGAIEEYTFNNVTANHTIDATFASNTGTKQYKLTVKAAGKGKGTVSSSDDMINCGGDGKDCSGTYYENMSIMLTATADENSIFTKWTGCEEADEDTCTVTMDKAYTVTANFARQFTLTVSKKGDGSISCKAGDKDEDDCTDTIEVAYAEGTKIILTQTPDDNSMFKGWSGHCKGKSDTCTIIMNGDKTVTANYESAEAKISVSPASIKFGTGKLNKAKAKKLKITNKGNAVLTITDIAVDGDFSTDWDGQEIQIASKKSIFVTVSFTPTSAGAQTATLSISSNDPNDSQHDVQLSGTGK